MTCQGKKSPVLPASPDTRSSAIRSVIVSTVYREVPLLSTLLLDISNPPQGLPLVNVITCLECFIKLFFIERLLNIW